MEISDLAAQNLLYAAPTIITVDPTVQTSPLNFTGCGVGGPTLSGKIVGGTAASLGAWPWQASLHVNGYHKCGASLISDSWLVAAAHCFNVFSNANQWTVVLGTIYSSSGTRLQVQEIIIHENYTMLTQRNDIALLKLSVPLNFTKYVRPVCLPETSDVFPDNSSCYVTGWGALKEGGGPSSILQQAEVKIISTAQCSSAEMYGNKIGPSMICAGYVEGTVDSCQGDSGGPLVAKQSSGTWVLAGIVSFGYGCALPNKPGVYARVSYLRNWITNNSGL
ncbi:transmembrane protease serine 11C-like [Spea bombifrons]|uniref:transmembrane protease serine 11C-like n=1 Tax=Spea bombifrons TaxID=233779 RepID=UPI00234B8503|nr:transmembrane protease serine 11C-like [Spea bombifrons]